MNEKEFIAKLKDTASRMQADGIDPIQIQGFIDQKKNEWKAKHGGKTDATAEETVTAVAGNQSELDLQSGNGLLEQPEDEGFFEGLYNVASKGYASAGATAETIDIMSPGYKSDAELQAYIEAKEEARSAENIIKSQQEFSEKVEKYKQEGDNGFLAGFKAFADDPSMGLDVMVSSLAGQVRAAQEAPGTVAATTAAGAAAGTFVVPVLGTVSGGLAGLRLSSMAVMEAQATFSELLDEKMQEQNLNLRSTSDLRKILDDEDAMDDLRRKAVGRGLAIGTIEAIFGKLAGSTGKMVNKASRLSKVGGAVGAVGIEAAGGMVGETAGMLVAGQELAGEEILLEGIAGTVFAPAQIAAAGLDSKAEYRLNGEKLNNKKAINEVVENSSDEDFVNTKINVKKDKDLSDRIQERRKNIIKNNKQAVKNKIAPKKAEELKAQINAAIKSAEIELKDVQEQDGQLAADAIEIKIKRLKQQLEDIDNHINFQLDELNEDETLALMNMDDDVSLYQSILNDPNSSEAAKKSAEEQLTILKQAQINVLNNTDSADLANPDGPTKKKNIDLSRKTQEAYENGGVNNYGEIAEHQMGTIKSIATSLWSRVPKDKQIGTYDDFVAAIISAPGGLRDMVASYDPSLGVPLAAYIGDRQKGLRKRANRIIKQLTKQDIQQSTDSTEVLNQFGDDINVDSIDFGPRFNYERLGLGKVLGNIESDVEIALQKTTNELEKLGEVTQKKRQSEAEKAFNSIFKNKYDKVIKDFVGKNTKTSKDFTDFIDKNFDTLRKIALSNINFQKGSGISNTWNTYAPSKQDFIDYYEGKDISPDSPSSVKSDRKKSLVEAIVADLSKSAREAYFETRPDEQTAFNEEQQIAFQEDTRILYNGSPKAFKDLGDRTGLIFLSTEKREASAYAESNRGNVKSIAIKNSDIATEQDILDAIKQQGINISEGLTYEFIDSRFPEFYIGEEAVNKVFETLAEKGFKAAQYEDGSQVTNKTTQSVVVFDKTAITEGDSAMAFQEAINEITGDNQVSQQEYQAKLEEYNKLTKPIFNQIAELTGKDPKEVKKEISARRGQLRNNSSKTKDFIENTLPKFMDKSQMEFLKNTFTTSSARRLQYPSSGAYEEALIMMEFINENLTTPEDKKALSKIKFRPVPVAKSIRSKMTIEERGKKMLDDYEKIYNAIFSDLDKYNKKVAAQENMLYKLLKGFEKAYSNDNALEIGAIFLGQSESMQHFIRALAIPKVFADPKNLTLDDIIFDSNGVPKLIEEEHSFKAVLAANTMFNMVANGTVDKNFDSLMTLYFQSGLLVKDNIALNKQYKDTMAPGTIFGDPLVTLKTYQAVGIDLSKYTSLINAVAEKLNIDEKGIIRLVKIQDLAEDNVPKSIQSGLQMQESNTPNPKLTNNETIEALSDMLGTIYGINVITGNKEKARKALEDAGYAKEDIEFALNQMGFNDPNSGIIYINSEKAGLDTPMHEFTHAWAEIVNKKDPALFNAIYDKLRSHPLYGKAVERMSKGKTYSKLSPDSFGYKNEVMAYILGEEGKSLYEVFEGDAEAKSLIDKFFDYVREALGFDPTVKNFADLTVDQVVKLAVKDILEGNPSANFNKLQNVAEGKSWFAKSEAAQSPSAKAKSDPIVRAFNKLKLSYRENKNLAEAINDAYSEVEGMMSFMDFIKLVSQNTKEIKTGKTNQLLIAKAEIIKANKIAEENAKKQAEQKLSDEQSSKLQNMFRRIIYQAKGEGAKASRWFIPPNAEDFKGLLYAFLPKGKAGVEARKWMEEHLIKPYSNGIATLDTEILHKSKAWTDMSEGFNFEEKVGGTPYTLGDAIKVYNALKEGVDPGIAKKKHLDALVHAVESNSEVLDLANEVAESFPIKLESGWQTRSFAKEIYDSINNGARKRHLETFSSNVDAIFSDATLDLIADQYGEKYRQAIVATLRRMKSGRNRVSTDASANSYMNWLNRAVGTTMFLNTRSALLQLLSTLNFIGKPGNNIFQATAAFANQKQWKADYNKLWNSDYLANRRDGAKFDVLADEIAEGKQGLNRILKFGFLPTRYADSFAIALGGAAYYRNRINMLMKEGMSEADAEAQAMIDWRNAAEESQQSSDPSKISEIQASSIGKIIYAFANTPFQYARITKRKIQDLASGRSAAAGTVRTDMQSILYYSVGQAIFFNALQSGLVALLNSDREEDEELKEEKYALMLERTLTSFAKSTGNPGAVASTLYAMMKEGYMQQTGKKRPDANAFAITATSISPPLNSKIRDLAGAYRAFNKIEEGDMFTPTLDNEALTMAGEVASFGGVPLDRVIRKARHLAAIKNEEAELWQKLWMLAGWSSWELGVNKENKPLEFKDVKFDDLEFEDVKFEDSAFNKLDRGVAGQANRDGTIEIDPNLSPVERAKTIAHEKQHIKDMDNGILDYDNEYVYWKGGKHKRKNGKIIYEGKSYIEGDPKLPWEKRAYNAEPSEKEIKRKKLYA